MSKPFRIAPDDLLSLADALGQEDAVFAPIRLEGGYSRGNALTYGKAYQLTGVRLEGTSGTAAERKEKQRWIEDAARRGLVVRCHAAGFAVRVRLTEAAELATRAVCGLPGLASAASLVAEVSGYEYADPTEELWFAPGVWVPEYPELTGPKDMRITVEEMAYPALRRGWLVSRTNSHGLVRYAVGPVPVPENVPDDDPPDDYRKDVRDAWVAGLKLKLAARAADDSNSREVGYIPLPVGWGRVRRKRKRAKTAAG